MAKKKALIILLRKEPGGKIFKTLHDLTPVMARVWKTHGFTEARLMGKFRWKSLEKLAGEKT